MPTIQEIFLEIPHANTTEIDKAVLAFQVDDQRASAIRNSITQGVLGLGDVVAIVREDIQRRKQKKS